MTLIFTLEGMLKIIAFGFILFNFTLFRFCLDKNSYLRDGWSILDFLIIIISLIDVIFIDEDLQSFKVIRLFRVLRPLRFNSLLL